MANQGLLRGSILTHKFGRRGVQVQYQLPQFQGVEKANGWRAALGFEYGARREVAGGDEESKFGVPQDSATEVPNFGGADRMIGGVTLALGDPAPAVFLHYQVYAAIMGFSGVLDDTAEFCEKHTDIELEFSGIELLPAPALRQDARVPQLFFLL